MGAKVVLFGAGATGRGHVGLLAWQAGCELVFIERDPELVRLLSDTGRYEVHYTGRNAVPDIEVTGFRVLQSDQRQPIAEEIAGADLVLTSVIEKNLPDVALTIALAVKACRQAGRTQPLNCVACENMPDSSSQLGGHVCELLKGDDLDYCERVFAFPDCMISRVVPKPDPDPLFITTENYNEWTVRAEVFKGPKPEGLEAMELVTNQTARLERKLFIHNGGHAICGYLGWHRGHRFIHEAVADPLVLAGVVGALNELGEVILRKWPEYSREEIDAYKAELGERGANPAMRDPVARVVRDPLRKLAPGDRLLGPTALAAEYGLPHAYLAQGIAAVLRYFSPEDEQSVRLRALLAEKPLTTVLEEVCAVAPDSPLSAELAAAYEAFDLT